MRKKILVHLIAAARPNFMKIAPLYHKLKREDWAEPIIVHTGQHYDLNMSDAFFKDLKLPEPDIHLGVGSGTHAEQTGSVMIKYEKILSKKKPDLVIVVGDVNSTMACTLSAIKATYKSSFNKEKKLFNNISYNPIKNQPITKKSHLLDRPLVAHLEAGLRSFDRTMPEEINRLVTDTLADILWTPSLDGDKNLIREGISKEKIFRVGNIMIDSLEMLRDKIEKETVFKEIGVKKNNYALTTFHRPANVDNPDILRTLCKRLISISRKIPIVFPVHPRTRKNLEKNNLSQMLINISTIHLIEPLSYLRFMNLLFNCRFALTDSGGIQEETTYLGVPCLTIRPNTERPITITNGTNRLSEIGEIEKNVDEILSGKIVQSEKIEFWDGQTAKRVVECLRGIFVENT